MDFPARYEKELRDLVYPVKNKTPQRKDYSTNTLFGIALDEYEIYEQDWRVALGQYHNAEAEIISRFKKELIQYFNLQKYPKVEKVYELAWQEGHSMGLYEVALEFENLVELLP